MKVNIKNLTIGTIILVFVSFFIISCEKTDASFDQNQDALSVKGDLYNLPSLSVSDYNIMREAINRMEVRVVDGKLITNNKSAKELGISDELYFYLQSEFEKANGNYKQYKRLRKKSQGETPVTNPSKEDSLKAEKCKCVPILLNDVLWDFGKAVSIDKIIDWCRDNNYYVDGKGVYPDKIENVVFHYLNASVTSTTSIPINYSLNQKNIVGGEYYLMSVKISNKEGHFVKVMAAFGEGASRFYKCHNPQDGETIVLESNVLEVFAINGTADF